RCKGFGFVGADVLKVVVLADEEPGLDHRVVDEMNRGRPSSSKNLCRPRSESTTAQHQDSLVTKPRDRATRITSQDDLGPVFQHFAPRDHLIFKSRVELVANFFPDRE